MSAEELAEEIEYQRVLLQSLDDSVEDREQAEAEIAAEIKRLERRLKALRAGHHNPIISTSEDMRAAFDDDPFASLQEVSCKNIRAPIAGRRVSYLSSIISSIPLIWLEALPFAGCLSFFPTLYFADLFSSLSLCIPTISMLLSCCRYLTIVDSFQKDGNRIVNKLNS